MRRWVGNVVVLLGAVVVLFLVLEVGMRVAALDGLQGCYLSAKHSFRDDEELCWNHFYEESSEGGIAKLDNDYFVLREYGIVLRPETKFTCVDGLLWWGEVSASSPFCDQLDGKYLVNAQGVHALENVTFEKDRARVLVFGDSFTFGRDAPVFLNYPSLLGMLSGMEVLNFAVGGSDVANMYFRYRDAEQFERDAVVLAVYTDDVRRAASPCTSWIKPVLDGLEVVVPAPTPEEVYDKFDRGVRSYAGDFLYYKATNMRCGERLFEEGLSVLEEVLDRMKNERLLVLIIADEVYDWKEQEREAQIVRLVREREIPFVQSRAVFEEYGNVSELQGGHFTALGHAVVAQELQRVLTGVGTEFSFVYVPHAVVALMGDEPVWVLTPLGEKFSVEKYVVSEKGGKLVYNLTLGKGGQRSWVPVE